MLVFVYLCVSVYAYVYIYIYYVKLAFHSAPLPTHRITYGSLSLSQFSVYNDHGHMHTNTQTHKVTHTYTCVRHIRPSIIDLHNVRDTADP